MEVFGTLTMDLSLKVDAAAPEEGLQQANHYINNDNIGYIELRIHNLDGTVRAVKYADVHNLTWFDAIE